MTVYGKPKMISISIIIPIYNVEPFVQRCLESVMAQDKAVADMECVIVDDCGTDGSMEIVRELIEAYHGPTRFVVVEHEQNLGLSAARNTGLSKAMGDYIMFVDSDDYLMPDSIQCFLDNLKCYPDADMTIGNVQDQKYNNTLLSQIQKPCFIDNPYVFFSRMLHHQIYLYAWNKFIRRSVLMEHNIRFIEGILYEDQAWSYELFSHLKSVLLLPEVTYVYENNPSSIVNTAFSLEKADKTIWSYTISCNHMLDNPPQPDLYSQNITVDYLLFMTNFLMNGVDVLSKYPVSGIVAKDFRTVRLRLLRHSLHYGRLLLSFFFLLLFPPFSYVQRLAIFRHHYYDLESSVNIVAHLTDFLHKRFRV